ncbi:MAG: hypothetical protein ACI83H_001457 [Glaciecola sp.]|jgi:hypothetical protein
MKNIKYILGFFLSMLLLTSCQEDDLTIGDLITPSNIEISVSYLDDADNDGEIDDVTVAPGLGSGLVEFSASAINATAFHFVIQGATKLQTEGVVEHNFTLLGNTTYDVTVIAFGTGGISTTKTIEVEVLALYEPPAELLTILHNNSQKSWRVAGELPEHFGLGPVGGDRFGEYYPNGSDQTNAKADAGMYDDRYIFHEDGTFEHITNGDVFGRIGLIEELGGSGGNVVGDDLEAYLYDDYSASYSLTAPGGVETINLSGLAFVGYYIGGDHKYEIVSRSANEMVIKSTDGNGQFDWWFRLIPE